MVYNFLKYIQYCFYFFFPEYYLKYYRIFGKSLKMVNEKLQIEKKVKSKKYCCANLNAYDFPWMYNSAPSFKYGMTCFMISSGNAGQPWDLPSLPYRSMNASLT